MIFIGQHFMQDDINDISLKLQSKKVHDIFALGLVSSEAQTHTFIKNNEALSMKVDNFYIALYRSVRNGRSYVKLSVNQEIRLPKSQKKHQEEQCTSSIYEYYFKEDIVLTISGLSVFGDFNIENGSLIAERIEFICRDQKMKTSTIFLDPNDSNKLTLKTSFKKRHKVMIDKRPLKKAVLF